MALKKQAIYLAINIGLVILNLRLWLFAPSVSSGNSHKSPGHAYQYVDYDLDSRENHVRSRLDKGKFRHQFLGDVRSGLLPSQEDELRDGISLDGKDIQEKIVDQWRRKKPNASVHLPETDVYVTPPTIKRIPDQDFSSLRKQYQVPKIEYTKLVNCAKILRNDSQEITKAKQIMASRPFFKVPIYEEIYQNWTQDCAQFRKNRGYVEVPLTREEEDFPLVFSIAMYKDVEQTERLLRAIYQPQNFYCIHIDTKSSVLIHRTMRAIANCFDNVWIATHLDKIKWGDVSILLPEINCMRDLVRYYGSKKWKYFINLTGQEFPLRTNYELVKIAKIFNGSNDIAGSNSRMDPERVNYRWTHRWSITYQQTIFYNTFLPHSPPPFNLTFFKGELHGLFSRRMVHYLAESDVAKTYLDWCWDTGHPSEHYWNVLNYNTQLNAPGGYIGSIEAADEYSEEPIIRLKNWVGLYDNRTCLGKVVRGICVYGIDDVPWIATRPELFANKFHLTFHNLGYDCLEELNRNRTMLKEKVPFNPRVYENLPTVLYSRKDGLS